MELANIFPSKYLKAHDLQGREPTVTIDRADIETIGEDRKLVLYFQGKEKGLVTNRTNADRIAYAYGSNTDNWIGQPITLYVDLVPFQGKTVEAIRVKVKPRQASVAAGNGNYELRSHGNVSTGGPRSDDGYADERAPQPPMRRADPSDEIPF